MSKYSEQFKLKAVNDFLAGGTSYRVVADLHGIEFGLLRRWVAGYQHHGADGLRKKPRCQHTPDFKLSVLQRMWDAELSYRETTALFNLRNPGQVGIWEQQYYSGGIEALSSRQPGQPAKVPKTPKTPKVSKTTAPSASEDLPSREQQLLAEVEYLRMENAYLKKLKALIQADELAARAKKRK